MRATFSSPAAYAHAEAYWFRNYPEFADAFKFAASAFDERVERALVERAIGYEVDSEEIRVVDGKVLHIPVRRQFPPDVGAATLYLTNRMPHKYKRMVEDNGETS